jgi:hypothetical protein
MLRIQRSVWRTEVGSTKTEESEAPIPVIQSLRHVLETYRKKIKPKDDDYILAGERKGTPLNLNNLARRVIIPAIKAGAGEEGLEGVARWPRERIVCIEGAHQGDCGYTKTRSFDVVEILHRCARRRVSESDGRD